MGTGETHESTSHGPAFHSHVAGTRTLVRFNTRSAEIAQGSARRKLDAGVRNSNDQGWSQIGPLGSEPGGRAIFEADGRYSFMIFRSDVPKFASDNINQVTPEESKRAIQGMTAFYGTWLLDEATKTLTTTIEGASSPNLTGGSQKRIITSITADELRYTNPASQIGTVDDVVWKRTR